MNRKPQERGQALILIVFAAVALFAFAALAIDGSRVFSDRRHAQNAADTSVLAAALAKVRAQDYAAAAQTRALSNGFENGVNSTVEVNTCDIVLAQSLTPPCEGLPAGADPAEFIQVVIRMITPTTFARIIGINEVPTVVTAIARASGTSSSSTSNMNAAIFQTKGGPFDQCFLVTGGGTVVTHDSGIFVNCAGAQALFMNGGGSLQMGDVGQVVGCNFSNGGATISPSIDCGAAPKSINASTFASVPTRPQAPSCGPPVTSPSNPLVPGTYSSLTITSNTTMDPGVYCFTGDIIVTSGASLTGTGGVQIVLQDQDIILVGGGIMDFTDLEIYANNGSVTVTAGSAFRADRLRYFSSGTGTVKVDGNAEITSGNAYFYLEQGDIIWNGQATVNLHGPAQGDTYGGLLVHKPWANATPLNLNGGSNINLTGTFMAPGSPVIYNGGTTFVLHSQIIGSTFTVNGQGQLDIFYDPNENYSPPNSPMIQLTK
jgi:hypothetical protein